MITHTWMQWMKERSSVRTYNGQAIHQNDMKQLQDWVYELNLEIEEAARFVIIHRDASHEDRQKLGTYGVIQGTNTYIALIRTVEEIDVVKLGYVTEKLVLLATGLGLGTCWLGGTFNRSDFEKSLTLEENEHLVILIAIGYKKQRQSLVEVTMRKLAKSDQRKAASKLFFDESFEVSLHLDSVDKYAMALEMLRIAPSASNKQPWRVLKSGPYYHFYCCRTPGYGLMSYDLQLNDIGIAKCHFELTALELGLSGYWSKIDHPSTALDWTYVDSWVSTSV